MTINRQLTPDARQAAGRQEGVFKHKMLKISSETSALVEFVGRYWVSGQQFNESEAVPETETSYIGVSGTAVNSLSSCWDMHLVTPTEAK